MRRLSTSLLLSLHLGCGADEQMPPSEQLVEILVDGEPGLQAPGMPDDLALPGFGTHPRDQIEEVETLSSSRQDVDGDGVRNHRDTSTDCSRCIANFPHPSRHE